PHFAIFETTHAEHTGPFQQSVAPLEEHLPADQPVQGVFHPAQRVARHSHPPTPPALPGFSGCSTVVPSATKYGHSTYNSRTTLSVTHDISLPYLARSIPAHYDA